MDKLKLILKYIFKKSFFLILFFLFFKNSFPRIFFAPTLEIWKQYVSQWDYPLSLYKKERKYLFLWDVGLTFSSQFAFESWFQGIDCDSQIKQDLAAIYHGSSKFFFNEIRPLGDQKDFLIQPSYRLNQSSCSVDIQLSKDFNYCDHEIRSTLRCIIPFVSNNIVNNNSAQMYYNYNGQRGRYKNNNLNSNVEYTRNSNEFNKEISNNNLRCNSIQSQKNLQFPRSSNVISTKVENGQNVFAVRVGGISSLAFPILQMDDYSNINETFIALNNNYPPMSKPSDILNNAAIARINSGGAIKDGSITALGNEGTANFTDKTNTYNNLQIQTANLYNDDVNFGVWPSTLKYTQFSTNQPVTIPYSSEYPFNINLTNYPNSVLDEINGTTSNINTFSLNAFGNNIPTNMTAPTTFKVIATGKTTQEPYNMPNIQFNYSPVVFQRTTDGSFPALYGISAQLPEEEYNTDISNGQFKRYEDFLATQSGGNVTLLNTDGSFLEDKPYAVLWYGWDYSNLFSNGVNLSKENKASTVNLDNLFMTSGLDQNGQITQGSDQIYNNVINNGDCCDILTNRVNKLQLDFDYSVEIINSLIDAMNITTDNINYLYELTQFSSTLNGAPTVSAENTSLHGASSALTLLKNSSKNNFFNLSSSKSKSLMENVEKINKNIENIENISLLNKIHRSSSENINYSNGISSQMQYNEFQQSGLGDIFLELLLGGYGFNDKLISEIILGLQLPTSKNVNSNDSYFATPIGTNGHYVFRFGGQMGYDLSLKIKSRINTRLYIEHAFKGYEQLIPEVENYPIFGFIPLKMDTNVSWNAGAFLIEGLIFATDFTNFTVGYQFWKKGTDNICMLNNFPVEITGYTDPNGEGLNVNFCKTSKTSGRTSQVVYGSVTSRLASDFILTLGFSNTVAGKNIPQTFDYFATIAVDF